MSESNVVSLESRRSHMEGPAQCLTCKQEWRAVAPTGTLWLDCNKCGTHKATWLYPIIPEVAFECNCGNRLFYYMPDGDMRCPHCGIRHDPQ